MGGLSEESARLKALFVHQNCPGQFRHLAPRLAADPANEIVFITQKGKPDLPGVKKIEYAPHRAVTPKIHPYLASSEAAVLNGQAVARVGFALAEKGFRPDVMIGNPGWGETLFLKDVWPEVPLISLSEFFYRGTGADVGFDPEFDTGPDARLRARARSAPHLLAIDAADAAYAPTAWQRAQFPEVYQDRISVIHDGIDTGLVQPHPGARLQVRENQWVSREDEVITFINRNLEPYRGYHIFMRALPDLLKRRPEAQVVLIGGDGVSYGSKPKGDTTWKQIFIDEVRGQISDADWARVHFLGRVPYDVFLSFMQVSRAHVYLTYPFVLSWSLLEAMSAGAPIVASDTEPVREALTDGATGLLVDFFDRQGIVDRVCELLDDARLRAHLRARARDHVVQNYDLQTKCLPRQLEWVDGLMQLEPRPPMV